MGLIQSIDSHNNNLTGLPGLKLVGHQIFGTFFQDFDLTQSTSVILHTINLRGQVSQLQ
jgi:hypothetical protein